MAIPLNRDDVYKKFKELNDKLETIDANTKFLVRLFDKVLKKKAK